MACSSLVWFPVAQHEVFDDLTSIVLFWDTGEIALWLNFFMWKHLPYLRTVSISKLWGQLYRHILVRLSHSHIVMFISGIPVIVKGCLGQVVKQIDHLWWLVSGLALRVFWICALSGTVFVNCMWGMCVYNGVCGHWFVDIWVKSRRMRCKVSCVCGV